MSLSDPSAIRDELREAVVAVLGRHGEFATKLVLIVETVGGADSARGLWRMAAEGQKAWDTLGLLDYCVTEERAAITARALRGDD